MKRFVIALWLGAMVLAGCGANGAGTAASSTSASAPAATPALRTKAVTITDLLAKNDWKAVRHDFDPTMLGALGEDELANAWKQVITKVGAYRSRGEPVQIPKLGGFIVLDTPMQFERGAMKSRLAFHPDGTIGGLFILIPEAP